MAECRVRQGAKVIAHDKGKVSVPGRGFTVAQACEAALFRHQQGQLDEADRLYRAALEIDGSHFQSLYGLGFLRLRQGKLEDARRLVRKALNQNPNSAAAHTILGRVLQAQNLYEESIARYKRALSIKPDHAGAYAGMGSALQELGRLDEAQKAIEKAIELAPTETEYYRLLSEIKHFSSGDPHLAAMEKLALESGSIGKELQVNLHFALAKAFSDLRQYERSFEHLIQGNTLVRQVNRYDEAATLGLFARIRATFTPEFIHSREGFGDESPVPVFIVGMPRSGSTLTEQILASHPKVFGAGEITDFFASVLLNLSDTSGHQPHRKSFPEMVSDVTGEQLRRIGTSYLTKLRAASSTAQRITNKNLENFKLVGLIHLALPNARIIHIRRDRADTCLSCFASLFKFGNEFSYDLGELGRYYRTYEGLMEYWRQVLPEHSMLEVQYEALVADLEPQVRRILTYCGLEWHEACLTFDRTERPIATASATQVRKPLYSNSVGRWRRYEKQLRPLLEALGTDL